MNGGEMLKRLSKEQMDERNKLIVELHKKGLTPAQISPQVRLGISATKKVLRNAKHGAKE